MSDNNSSTETVAALTDLCARTQILETKMQQNINETMNISSKVKKLMEMMQGLQTRLEDVGFMPQRADKLPMESSSSPPLPAPDSYTTVHAANPNARHTHNISENDVPRARDSSMVTQVCLPKLYVPTFNGEDVEGMSFQLVENGSNDNICLKGVLDEFVEIEVQIKAFPLHLLSSLFSSMESFDENGTLRSSDSFCPQAVRQNAYETLSLFSPPKKPPDEFATAMNETGVLVDVYNAIKTGWILLEEPPSSRDYTRPSLRVSEGRFTNRKQMALHMLTNVVSVVGWNVARNVHCDLFCRMRSEFELMEEKCSSEEPQEMTSEVGLRCRFVDSSVVPSQHHCWINNTNANPLIQWIHHPHVLQICYLSTNFTAGLSSSAAYHQASRTPPFKFNKLEKTPVPCFYDNMGFRVYYDAPDNSSTKMAHIADGTRLFSCGTNKEGESHLVEWNENEGAVRRSCHGLGKRSLGIVQFAIARNRILVAGDESVVKYWDMDKINMLATADADGGLPASPCLSFSKYGILLALSTNDNGIKVLANGDGVKVLWTMQHRLGDPSRDFSMAAVVAKVQTPNLANFGVIDNIVRSNIGDQNTSMMTMGNMSNDNHGIYVNPRALYEAGERSRAWILTKVNEPSHCRSLRRPDNVSQIRIARLIYTNSGVALLALVANEAHKLRRWSRNVVNVMNVRINCTCCTLPLHYMRSHQKLTVVEQASSALKELQRGYISEDNQHIMILFLSLSRPPEAGIDADLEDKVNFKGRGMLRMSFIKDLWDLVVI